MLKIVNLKSISNPLEEGRRGLGFLGVRVLEGKREESLLQIKLFKSVLNAILRRF